MLKIKPVCRFSTTGLDKSSRDPNTYYLFVTQTLLIIHIYSVSLLASKMTSWQDVQLIQKYVPKQSVSLQKKTRLMSRRFPHTVIDSSLHELFIRVYSNTECVNAINMRILT